MAIPSHPPPVDFCFHPVVPSTQHTISLTDLISNSNRLRNQIDRRSLFLAPLHEAIAVLSGKPFPDSSVSGKTGFGSLKGHDFEFLSDLYSDYNVCPPPTTPRNSDKLEDLGVFSDIKRGSDVYRLTPEPRQPVFEGKIGNAERDWEFPLKNEEKPVVSKLVRQRTQWKPQKEWEDTEETNRRFQTEKWGENASFPTENPTPGGLPAGHLPVSIRTHSPPSLPPHNSSTSQSISIEKRGNSPFPPPIAADSLSQAAPPVQSPSVSTSTTVPKPVDPPIVPGIVPPHTKLPSFDLAPRPPTHHSPGILHRRVSKQGTKSLVSSPLPSSTGVRLKTGRQVRAGSCVSTSTSPGAVRTVREAGLVLGREGGEGGGIRNSAEIHTNLVPFANEFDVLLERRPKRGKKKAKMLSPVKLVLPPLAINGPGDLAGAYGFGTKKRKGQSLVPGRLAGGKKGRE